MHNDDLFKVLLHGLGQSLLKDLDKRNPTYEEMEYNCETSITDENMLRLQIDSALDSGNKELFMELTNQLGYGVK